MKNKIRPWCIYAGTLLCMMMFSAAGPDTAFGATYYGSPDGNGDGLSEGRPFRIADFWPIAQPGDTIVLLDGIYRGADSMVDPYGTLGKALRGTSSNPITIRAQNEGSVTIDGEHARIPVNLVQNDWFVIEGINAHSSTKEVVRVNGSANNIIRKVCAWDANSNHANGQVFYISSGGSSYQITAENNLIEDCAGFGEGRKIFVTGHQAENNTFRRCWGRWEGSIRTGPKMTYSTLYNSYDTKFENCIGTWDGRRMPESSSNYYSDEWHYYDDYNVDQPYGIFGADRHDAANSRGATVRGCIAYLKAAPRLRDFIGLFQNMNWNNNTNYSDYEDCIAYRDPSIPASRNDAPTFHFGQIITGRKFSSLSDFGPATAWYVAGLPSDRFDAGTIYEDNDGSELVAAYGHIMSNPDGATVMKRYINGVLTSDDLWPWPMDQRIYDAMLQAGYSDPIRVTDEVFGLAGGAYPGTQPPPPVVDDGLLVHWGLNEGGGSTAHDSTDNGFDGAISGASWVSPGYDGTGYALSFDGSDDHVVDEDGEQYLNGLSEFTVSVWVKSNLLATDRGILSGVEPDGMDTQLSLRYDAAGYAAGGVNVIKAALGSTGGTQALESGENVTTRAWQHLVMRWRSGNELELFIDGVPDTPTYNDAATSGTVTGLTKLILGKGQKVTSSWDGWIDEFKVFSYSLSDAQIEDLSTQSTR